MRSISRGIYVHVTGVGTQGAGWLLQTSATVNGAGVGDDNDEMEIGEVSMAALRERTIAKGMTEAQLEDMLREYTELGVLYVTADRSKIRTM